MLDPAFNEKYTKKFRFKMMNEYSMCFYQTRKFYYEVIFHFEILKLIKN